MNLEYFIAKRLITTRNYKSGVSASIIKIAILAIAIGMIMMIIAVATGIGLQKKIREKVAAFNGHISITTYDNNQSDITLLPISTKQDFYPKFNSIPQVVHIQAIATKSCLIKTKLAFEGIIFKGVDDNYNWNIIKSSILFGKIPVFEKTISQEVLLSKYLANRLNLKLGDFFTAYFMGENQNKIPKTRRFKIAGIFNSEFQEFDSSYIIGDIRHIQKMNKWSSSQVGAFEVFINDFNSIDNIEKEIYKKTPSNLNTKTITQKYSYLFEWLKLFDFNIIIIIAIMILVATINMVVALLVLILERTQMIGILKAMGQDNWSIRKIFLYNAFFLIIRGLFWGNLIGIILLLFQKYFGIIELNPENYYVSQVPVYLNFILIFYLNLLTIVICLLVLLIPSHIIAKISPSRAIQFD